MENTINFVNMELEHPNRRKIKIIRQTGNEILADVELAETPTVQGTPINAQVMNNFQNAILHNETVVNTANSNSQTAISTANTASLNAQNAVTLANTADSKADTAITTANTANANANEALNQVVQMQGTKIYYGTGEDAVLQSSINFTSDPQAQLNNKEPSFTKNTAFNKNFGAVSETVCEGNDPRLSDARPASDVSAWAKATTKPSYTASEVGALSSTATNASASITTLNVTTINLL